MCRELGSYKLFLSNADTQFFKVLRKEIVAFEGVVTFSAPTGRVGVANFTGNHTVPTGDYRSVYFLQFFHTEPRDQLDGEAAWFKVHCQLVDQTLEFCCKIRQSFELECVVISKYQICKQKNSWQSKFVSVDYGMSEFKKNITKDIGFPKSILLCLS